MQFGHFDDAAREYVVDRPDTPKPWSNYLGTTEYGAVITNNAGGYSFYQSAAIGRFLRLRFNAVPLDQPGRYFYLRDRESKDYWSSSWQPVAKPLDQYKSTCRHGMAYTVIESTYSDIKTESTYFVPLGQKFEYWRLKITNTGKTSRKLSVFTYCEFASNWSMQQDLVNLQYSLFIVRGERQDNLLRISINDALPADPTHFTNNDQGRWSWMGVVGGTVVGHDTHRDAFIGPYGTYAMPDVVKNGACTNRDAFGDSACGALQIDVDLAAGESRELLVLLGVGKAEVEGKQALAEFGNTQRCARELEAVKVYWHGKLGAVEVKTPDADFDHMVNVWNAYNAMITFNWSRAASLVYNGERDGLGFRDSVQDVLGIVTLQPEDARKRLELMLTGQLAHGGAMSLVRPFAHKPGQEKCPPDSHMRSDDSLWFFNAVPAYVAETGDIDFYKKVLPYADHGEATVMTHLRRAIEFNLDRVGAHQLPCGLEADWNDCLKLGHHGESVFVTFQVRFGLDVYGQIADRLGLKDEAHWAREQLAEVDRRIQKSCWDGQWFIWAIGEDGTVYGTQKAAEGQIYLNTQVWAVISGAASADQAKKALSAVHDKLATPYGVMLCAPPFVNTPVKVMRAVLFTPGVKENGGIFSHTQSWAVMAECLQGNGDRAYEYYRAFMPSAYNDKAEVRQIEPYVHCQTTHSKYSKQYGVSRVPWLSGTVAWSYFTAVQHILGIKPEIDGLRIDPCIPKNWPGFKVNRKFRGKVIAIEVENPSKLNRGVKKLELNGETISGNLIPVNQLREKNTVKVTLG